MWKYRKGIYIPEELRNYFYQKRELLKDLQDAGYGVVVIAVVHTFGSDLKWNPHIHALFTEGGIDKNKPEIFQDSQLKAMNSIVTDFISSQGYNLSILCEFQNNEKYETVAAVIYSEIPQVLLLNESLLLQETKYKDNEQLRSIEIVDTLLHECCHLILKATDGDYDFEKKLYDFNISSNYIKRDPEFLRELLKLTNEEFQDYIKNRENIFENKYSKYINEFLNA